MSDFERLGQLARNLERLSQVPSQVAKDASKGINEAIQEQFRSGTDPYRKPWKPLLPSTLAKGRTPPPLTDTSTLKDNTQAKPAQGAGIVIEIGAPYGVFHQYGTKHMVARKILPEGTFPKSWSEVIRNAAKKAVKVAIR